MDWQILAVVLVVGGAIAFLVLRFTGIRLRPHPPAQTFVPLSSLKKKHPRKSGGCH